MRPEPLIAVADVEASRRFYQRLLGAVSGHGGAEYEQLICDGRLILQLHALDVDHHHGPLGVAGVDLGNGLLLLFETEGAEAFDAAVARARALGAQIRADVHVNPNAGHREIWLQDPDGYLVVLAEPF